MKKLLLILTAALLGFASCSKDNYIPGPGGSGSKQKEDEPKEEQVQKVGDRCVIAYCTYYGTAIPDASVLTQINYSFAELYFKNGKYDHFELKGKWDKYSNGETRFRKIVDLKKLHPDLKICLSFSHGVSNYDNAQDGGFSGMSADPESRKKFAADCLAFCKKWGIDGIDIDWEFPTISWSGAACDKEHDTQNYTLMMKQLRETLGDSYILSYAGYTGSPEAPYGMKYIDIKAVDPYVDFVNIMTYDIASGAAGQHQSALFKSSMSSYWDIERSVDEYLKVGIKPEKLLIGIPFYARHDWDNNGEDKGVVDFRDFDKEYTAAKGFKTDNWDDVAKVPYVTRNGKMWAGYDNPRSIAVKGDWIREKGLRGMMYWDYDGDDASGTLRKAVWAAVMTK